MNLRKNSVMLLVLVLTILAAVSASGSVIANSCCGYQVTQSGETLTTQVLTFHSDIADGEPLNFSVAAFSQVMVFGRYNNADQLVSASTVTLNQPDYFNSTGPSPIFTFAANPNYTVTLATQNLTAIFKALHGTSNDSLHLLIQGWVDNSYGFTKPNLLVHVFTSSSIELAITYDGNLVNIDATVRQPIPNAPLKLIINVTLPYSNGPSTVALRLFGFPSLVEPNYTTMTSTWIRNQWTSGFAVYPYQSYTLPFLYIFIAAGGLVILVALVDTIRKKVA